MKNSPQSARSSRFAAGMQGFLTLVMAACIVGMINYLGIKYYEHIDLSKDQYYTLSSKTEETLKVLQTPVTFFVFPMATQNARSDDGKQGQILSLLKEYERVGGSNVRVQKLDPQSSADLAVMNTLHDQVPFPEALNIVIIEMGKQAKVVNVSELYTEDPFGGQGGGQSLASFKGEQVFTTALFTMIDSKPEKIYFTTGHHEISINQQDQMGGSSLQSLMRRENLDPLEFSLATSGAIPADAGAVVVLGPTDTFQPFEADAIAQYLKNKGHLILALAPYKVSGLESVLAAYSLKFDDDLVATRVTQGIGSELVPIGFVLADGISGHPITQKFQTATDDIAMGFCRSIQFGFTNIKDIDSKTTFLFRTSEQISCFGLTKHIDPQVTSDEFNKFTFDEKTDLKGPLTLAAVYDENFVPGGVQQVAGGTPGTKIVLFGAPTIVANRMIAQSPIPANVFVNALDWMVKANPVLGIEPKAPQDYQLSVSPLTSRTLLVISMLVIPGIFLGMGVLTWLSRRK